jgi:hypothetical protein
MASGSVGIDATVPHFGAPSVAFALNASPLSPTPRVLSTTVSFRDEREAARQRIEDLERAVRSRHDEVASLRADLDAARAALAGMDARAGVRPSASLHARRIAIVAAVSLAECLVVVAIAWRDASLDGLERAALALGGVAWFLALPAWMVVRVRQRHPTGVVLALIRGLAGALAVLWLGAGALAAIHENLGAAALVFVIALTEGAYAWATLTTWADRANTVSPAIVAQLRDARERRARGARALRIGGTMSGAAVIVCGASFATTAFDGFSWPIFSLATAMAAASAGLAWVAVRALSRGSRRGVSLARARAMGGVAALLTCAVGSFYIFIVVVFAWRQQPWLPFAAAAFLLGEIVVTVGGFIARVPQVIEKRD